MRRNTLTSRMQTTGPIPHPVPVAYIWGDALPELDHRSPDVRIINLETSMTTSRDPWRGKEVLYKMHPANIGCLAVARIDCCVLANNHVLDWGYRPARDAGDAGYRRNTACRRRLHPA